TSRSSNVRAFVAAVEIVHGAGHLHRDWELLIRLNELLEKRTLRRDDAMLRPADADAIDSMIAKANLIIENQMEDFDLPFEVPEVHFLGVLWPSDADA
ncbi:MAG: hypothetical protein KDB00_19685, partial [Planctomycetales bacterium]|nr:hypothetical protein [Planctomycetales bacterium]